MAGVLSRLQIVLSADTANYRRQMRSAQDTASKFGNVAKKSMKLAATGIATGAAIATAAIGGITKAQLSASKEIVNLSRISNATTTQFQKDAIAARNYGIEMDQLGDISKDTKEKIGEFVNTGGGGMQDFADAMGYSEQQAKAFAVSMQGLSGIEVLQEMTNQMEGAGKSTEQISHALEGMGSDATNLIPLLSNSGKEFKKLGDQAERAGAIMSADTIAAAQELNGNLNKMKNQWAGIKNIVFSAVLPALSAAAQWFVTNKDEIQAFATKAMDLSQTLGGHLVTGFNLARDAITVINDKLLIAKGFITEHKELFIALGTGVGVAAASFATGALAVSAWTAVAGLAAGATAVFGASIAIITSPVTLVVAAITGLVAAGVYLYRNWDEIKAKASALWGDIKDSITSNVELAKNSAISKFNSLKTQALASFNALPGPVKTALSAISGLVKTQIAIFKTVFKTGLEVIKAVLRGDMEGVKATISNGMGQLAGIARTKIGAVVGAIKSIGPRLAQTGRDLIAGLIQGIKAKASEAINAVGDMANAMYQKARNFFVIRSPSRLFRKEVGAHLPTGIALGIKDNVHIAVNATKDMAKEIYQGFIGKWNELKKSIALFGNKDAVTEFDYDVGTGAYKGWSDSMIKSYRSELQRFEQMKSAEDAKQSALTEIKNRAKQFATDQKSTLDAFNGLDINGPQSESDRLRESYQKKMAIVDQFEQMHTDKKAQAEAARTTIAQQYQQSIQQLEQTQIGNSLTATAGMFKSLLGESNAGYKTLFLMQKAYDFASAQSASFKAIAEAWGSAPFPANIPNVLMTTLKTGVIPAAIQAIKPQGFMAGGYTGNYPTDMAIGPVHGKEFVAHADATKKYRPELEAMNNGTYGRKVGGGDTKINVNVTVNSNGQSSVESDAKVGRNLGQVISAAVKKQLLIEQRQGGMLRA